MPTGLSEGRTHAKMVLKWGYRMGLERAEKADVGLIFSPKKLPHSILPGISHQ